MGNPGSIFYLLQRKIIHLRGKFFDALEKHAADLREASTERRGEILAQIEKDVQKEVRRRGRMPDIDTLLY